MLRQRVITAIVLVLVLVGALAVGPTAFVAFAAVAFGAAAFEWLRLAGWHNGTAVTAGVLAAVLLYLLDRTQPPVQGSLLLAVVAGSCLAWLGVAAWVILAERANRLALSSGAVALAAPILLGGAWFALLAMYRRGALYLFSALALVWIADIAAYFAGRAFGRRKLAPHISPGKTWAGAAGAVAAVLLAGAATWLAWPQGALFSNSLFERAPLAALVTLAALVAVSIVGDLFESLLKRHAGVKDSSKLLPGHGGVLDRIDALLPVLPAAVLIEVLL